MPSYKYRAYDTSGKLISGEIDASGEEQALRKAAEQGLVVVDVALQKSKKGASGGKPLSLTEHIMFCRSFGAYLKSGLNLSDALRLLVKQTTRKRLKEIYEKLLEEVEGGRGLGASMEETGAFREGLLGMIVSGEQSGSLYTVLERGAGLYRQEQQLRRKIQNALTYPLVMLFVGSGVVLFLLTYVVPKLAGLFSDLGQKLPLPTRILLGIAEGVRSYGLLLALLLVVGIVLFRKSGKKVVLPFAKELRNRIALSLVLSQVGALLEAGIPLVQALDMAAPMDASNPQRWKNVGEQVRKGYRFAAALEQEDSFDEEIVYMMRVGEMGGTLPDSLRQAGENAWETAQNTMERLANLAEPLLVLSLALVVGFVVVAVLLPVFDISGLIQ